MGAVELGRRAGREFVEECRRKGVREINPSTLPRERFWAIADRYGVARGDEESFARGFWEAMVAGCFFQERERWARGEDDHR
jgi:hypothetical protein